MRQAAELEDHPIARAIDQGGFLLTLDAPAHRVRLVGMWVARGHEELGMAELRATLHELQGSLKVTNALAEALAAGRRPQEAIDLLEPAIAVHPDHVHTLCRTAMVIEESGSPAQALEVIRHAADLAPRASTVQKYLGSVLQAAGHANEALAAFRAAAELAPRTGVIRNQFTAGEQPVFAAHRPRPHHSDR